MIEAFPLNWPAGWKRTPEGARAFGRFSKTVTRQSSYVHSDGTRNSWKAKDSLTIAEAVLRVRAELQRMGVQDDDLVISSNLKLRLDGFPRSGQGEPDDPGIAVYWRDTNVDGWPMRCMAVDRYQRVADNIAAVAATLDAMRAIERHGGAEILNRAFTGFAALEAPGASREHWSATLGVASTATRADIDAAWHRLRGRLHPDRHGGDESEFKRVSAAYKAACLEVSG